jgi:hypothetical protein
MSGEFDVKATPPRRKGTAIFLFKKFALFLFEPQRLQGTKVHKDDPPHSRRACSPITVAVAEVMYRRAPTCRGLPFLRPPLSLSTLLLKYSLDLLHDPAAVMRFFFSQ